MFGCKCFSWSKVADFASAEPDYFSLPSPLPKWPKGDGFGTGRINLGELEVLKITKFEFIWDYNQTQDKKKGVSFYKPVELPDRFFTLGHYCQSNNKPINGFILVAREIDLSEDKRSPALQKPLDYTLIWSSNDSSDENLDGCGYFWLPQPPAGYKAAGFLVTDSPIKPDLEELRCVRADLTDICESYHLIFTADSKLSRLPFRVWNTRPQHRGMWGKGVHVGTFFCSGYWSYEDDERLYIACLKNVNSNLHAMPNLDQIHAIIGHYGPTVFFHPDELYLPSSVPWFFKNGAMLYKKGELKGESIDLNGSNLPVGGTNDGEYWIDIPSDNNIRNSIEYGDLDSAELYVHVKPALGGTFTDIAMWVFCPFNGPVTLKIGILNFALTRLGQHLGDWEHFTLRVSNYTGELWSIYFSQHSGGKWIDACDLEFVDGNKCAVYASKHGHAMFPHPGSYIQGSSRLGIGVRNDTARSDLYVDSSINYAIVAAEYLGNEAVMEPGWLQFMREWGPTVVYDSRTELDKIMAYLPVTVRYSVENIFNKLPLELYGEEGPTGPKEKNNWVGDERG